MCPPAPPVDASPTPSKGYRVMVVDTTMSMYDGSFRDDDTLGITLLNPSVCVPWCPP